MISERAKLLKPSPTLALSALAKELESKGHPVINLTVGEPDWPTFASAKKAAISAIENNFTKYTVATGIQELKHEICEWTELYTGVNYHSSQIAVTSGAKFALYALFQMILNPGDEVLIPSPYWVSYPAMVEQAGGISVVVGTSEESHFRLRVEDLESKISTRTKALILCSPSNPTGSVYSLEELAQIGEVVKKHPNLVLVLDDIYNSLCFNSEFAPHLLKACPDLKDRVFIINGASKSFSMTGWRIGWILGPNDVMKALGNLISQSTSNPSSVSQMAVLAALKSGSEDLQKARKILSARLALCEEQMRSLKYFKLCRPEGAFYLWVNVLDILGKKYKDRSIETSKALSEILLSQFYLATVPGVEFGCEGYLRMSFACSDSDLREAFSRLRNFENQI